MEEKEFDPNVEFVPTPDVVIKSRDKGDVTASTRKYTVAVPEEESKDFIVEVRASQLREIRNVLETHAEIKFPWQEILLALSGVLIGGFFSALFSSLEFESFLGKFVYIGFPFLAGILGTAYFFVRHGNVKNINELSDDLLKKIPDPNNVTKK